MPFASARAARRADGDTHRRHCKVDMASGMAERDRIMSNENMPPVIRSEASHETMRKLAAMPQQKFTADEVRQAVERHLKLSRESLLNYGNEPNAPEEQ